MVSSVEIGYPQFPFHECSRNAGTQQVINLPTVWRYRQCVRVALRGNLPIAPRLAKPCRALFGADRGNERTTGRIQSDSLFLRGTKSDLLCTSIGKMLAPDMEAIARIGRKIHPAPICRPCRACALAGDRSHLPAQRTAIEGNQAAR